LIQAIEDKNGSVLMVVSIREESGDTGITGTLSVMIPGWFRDDLRNLPEPRWGEGRDRLVDGIKKALDSCYLGNDVDGIAGFTGKGH
jgi:hypothetical protein